MTQVEFQILNEPAGIEPDIEALTDKAFGPGRHAKTSYRLREGSSPIEELSLIAKRGDLLVGTIRFSPIWIGDSRALLLGPLAVDPSVKGQGCGLALMGEGLKRARDAGHVRVILVGDLPYYAKAGFSQVPEGRISFPGPVDPQRLLWHELVSGAFESVGGRARADTGQG